MKRMIGILFLSMLNFTACQQGEESFPASNDTGKIAAPEIASQSPIDSELLKKAFDAAEAAFRKEVELKPSESVYRSLVGLYIEEPSGEVLSSNSNWIYQFVLSSTTDFTKRRNVTMSLKDMKASVTADPTPLSAYIGEEYIPNTFIISYGEIENWVQTRFDQGCLKTAQDPVTGKKSLALLELTGSLTSSGPSWNWNLFCAQRKTYGKNARTGEESEWAD